MNCLDFLRESFKSEEIHARQWEQHYTTILEKEDKAFWKGRADALAQCREAIELIQLDKKSTL